MRLRFGDESGVALVMAVWILAFLMLMGSSLVFYAGSGASHAETSTEDARAVNLAEAGENYARAILYNAADPTVTTAVGAGQLTLEGGTVDYSGTYDTAAKIWTLTGIGTHANPTAGAAPISRTVSSKVLVSSSTGLDPAWGYLFADTTSCTTLGNNLTIDAPIYVKGDLCMENSAIITADLVQVRGKVQIKNSASIGTAATPVGVVRVGGGCRYPWTGAYVSPCTSAHRVYRTAFFGSVPDLTKPPIDLPTWYANAKPGPMSQVCAAPGSFPGTFDNDTALNRSNPMQNLFPTTAYDCQAAATSSAGSPIRPEPREHSLSRERSSSTASSSSRGTETSSTRARARSMPATRSRCGISSGSARLRAAIRLSGIPTIICWHSSAARPAPWDSRSRTTRRSTGRSMSSPTSSRETA